MSEVLNVNGRPFFPVKVSVALSRPPFTINSFVFALVIVRGENGRSKDQTAGILAHLLVGFGCWLLPPAHRERFCYCKFPSFDPVPSPTFLIRL